MSEYKMPLARKPLAYLASPCGFSLMQKESYEKIDAMLRKIGWEVLDPWKLTDPWLVHEVTLKPRGLPQMLAWKKLNPVIYRNNIAAIESCDMVLAILDGMEPDSGTSFEVGHALALKKMVEILRLDFRDAGDNPGCCLNIMLQCGAEENGGHISRDLDSLRRKLRGKFMAALRKIQSA